MFPMLEDSQLNDQGGEEEMPKQPQQPLDKNQKIAAAGLAVFAVLVIVLWFAQLKSSIYGPFNAPVNQNQVATVEQNSDEALKAKDTDGDSLSDYDELNIYGTSPYLEDTDGDGLKDGDEIKNNTDPNCPSGRDCTGGLNNPVATDTTATGQATTTGASVLPDAGLNNITSQNETLNSLLNQFGAS
ncbi:MAG: hypothetical protein ACOYK9_04310, partial [Chlamydiia bacterium]